MICYKDYIIRKRALNMYMIYSVTGATMTKRTFGTIQQAKNYIDEVIYAQ